MGAGKLPEGWFQVAVQSAQYPGPLLDSQIVFHGVNKSGSLCMAKVLRESYLQHGRLNQFLSHYYSGIKPELFRDNINNSTGHAFFVGHNLYGAVDAPKHNRVLVSQLRHPLPRIVSCFQWLRNKHEMQHGSVDGFPSLEAFIRRGNGKAHSQIIQFGAGFGPDRAEMKKLSCHDLLLRSQEKIERDVLLVGIAEQFEETVFLFAHLCGLPAVPPWYQDIRNKGRPLISQLSKAATDLIADTYQHDFALYQWAKGRFDATVSAANIGGDIKDYKAACASQYKERFGATPIGAIET